MLGPTRRQCPAVRCNKQERTFGFRAGASRIDLSFHTCSRDCRHRQGTTPHTAPIYWGLFHVLDVDGVIKAMIARIKKQIPFMSIIVVINGSSKRQGKGQRQLERWGPAPSSLVTGIYSLDSPIGLTLFNLQQHTPRTVTLR